MKSAKSKQTELQEPNCTADYQKLKSMDEERTDRNQEPGMPEMVVCECLADERSSPTKVTVSCPHGLVQVEDKYAHYLAVNHRQNTVRGHALDMFDLQVSETMVELHFKGDHIDKSYRWLFGINGELHISALDLAVAGYAARFIFLGKCQECPTWTAAVVGNGDKTMCGCLECDCNVKFGTVHTPISPNATDFVANTHPSGQNTAFGNYKEHYLTWETWLADRACGSKELYGNTISTSWDGAKVVLVEMDKVMITSVGQKITKMDGKWQMKVQVHPYQPSRRNDNSWQGDIAAFLSPRHSRDGYTNTRGSRSPRRLWSVSTQRLEQVNQPYVAVSYVWFEYSDEMLRQALTKTAAQIGIEYFWVDRWCITQDAEVEKVEEIAMMGDYYADAAATLILVDAIDRKIRGKVESYYKALSRHQLDDLLALADEIARSGWAKRVWTFQEGWIGRNPIIRTKHQWIDAGLVELAIRASNHFVRISHYLVTLGGINFAGGTVSGACNVQTGNGLTMWRTWFAGGSELPPGCCVNNKGSLCQAIHLAKGRHATIEEDHIYGLLAAVEGGADVEVKYGIGVGAVLDQQLRLGRIDTAMLSATKKRDSNSWQPCFRDGIPHLESFKGAKMQWHDGGKVSIAAALVEVKSITIINLESHQQVALPSPWTGVWKVRSGIYLLVLPDNPQESNYCLFLTGKECSKFDFYKESASKMMVPRPLVCQMKAWERQWTVT